MGLTESLLEIHLGNKHGADLGDGDDNKVQRFIAMICIIQKTGSDLVPLDHSGCRASLIIIRVS